MHACPLIDEAITYSLRQMTPDEERAYQAHLAACPSCRLKLAEVTDTLDLLPLSAPPVAPPPELRAKVLDRVAAEAKAETAQTVPVRKRWLLPAWAASAAAVALVIGTYAVLRVEGLQQRVLGFQQSVKIEQTVNLVGTQSAQTATGRVLVAREGNGTRISLQAQGLPPLKPGEAYQLWLIKDGKRTSGGVFVVDATGQGGVATWLPTEAQFDALGVTREPDALGMQPRGPKVMGSAT